MGPLTEGIDPKPFIVFGLPRSRTKWLSEFLSYGGWKCHHDLPTEISDISEMRDLLLDDFRGTVETGLARGFRMIKSWRPGIRVAVVKRPVADVISSAAALDWHISQEHLEMEEALLDCISEFPGVLTVNFEDLADEGICHQIFEHCLDLPFDRDWWLEMKDKNIQIDLPARQKNMSLNVDRVLKVFDQINSYVTYQEEDFDSVYRDGKDLFAQHVEEADNDADPNFDLTRQAYMSGALKLFTARTPESMLGYLIFIISPSFSNYHDIEALQGPFFVRKDRRGKIGIKLHEFARKQLKLAGVTKLALKAGIHADGPKFHRFYQSIGAEPVGTLYSLSLKD